MTSYQHITSPEVGSNPDAALFTDIADCAARWRESAEADDRGLQALSDERSDVACELERRIWSAKVATAMGFNAKLQSIMEADHDAGDLILLGFLLGCDAERLKVAETASQSILDLALKAFKATSANMDVVEDRLNAMLSNYAGDAERSAAH